jgi:transposase-like protein
MEIYQKYHINQREYNPEDILFKTSFGEKVYFFFVDVLGGNNMKYTEEVKAKAVKAAQEGMSLKLIQKTLGPNPKATLRYLAKAGVDYKKVRDQLIKEGKIQPGTSNGTKPNPAAEKKK